VPACELWSQASWFTCSHSALQSQADTYVWTGLQGPAAPKPAEQQEADALDDTKFDVFMGNDTGMFAFGEYDKDDKEADEVRHHHYLCATCGLGHFPTIWTGEHAINTEFWCLYQYMSFTGPVPVTTCFGSCFVRALDFGFTGQSCQLTRRRWATIGRAS
jgi:hypothetical protein